MLIALTGASGFIGSHIAATLHRAGHEVRALVRPTSRRDHIAPLTAQWIEGDAADPQAIAALVAGVDAVVHNANDWHARKQSPVTNYQTNTLGTLRLLDATRQAGANQFVFVSSVAVYDEIPQSANGRITEETAPWPGGIYGAHKAAIEPHLKAYHKTYGMNTSSWRPAAVYGIDPKLERSQWFDLIRSAKQGGTIDTAEKGGQGGKITHVQDVADALTLAIGDESVAGQFYNLVDGYMYWQRAAEFAKELTNSTATIVDRTGPGPKNQFDCAKAIEFFDRHGNTTALRRGEAGVRAYVADMLARL